MLICGKKKIWNGVRQCQLNTEVVEPDVTPGNEICAPIQIPYWLLKDILTKRKLHNTVQYKSLSFISVLFGIFPLKTVLQHKQ